MSAKFASVPKRHLSKRLRWEKRVGHIVIYIHNSLSDPVSSLKIKEILQTCRGNMLNAFLLDKATPSVAKCMCIFQTLPECSISKRASRSVSREVGICKPSGHALATRGERFVHPLQNWSLKGVTICYALLISNAGFYRSRRSLKGVTIWYALRSSAVPCLSF